MSFRPVFLAAAMLALAYPAVAQSPSAAPQPRAVTRTMYTAQTELFAEFRPLVVGEATRITAHLTGLGDRFRPYAEGKVTLALTVDDATVSVTADGPERAGVFRLPVTPTKAGTGRIVIEVHSQQPPERFVLDDVPVYSDMQAVLASEGPADPPGLVRYTKERSWEVDFATAEVKALAGKVVVPAAALVRDQDKAWIYVQRTPEVFELREVVPGATANDTVEIASGVRAGERIVVRGAGNIPRK